MPRETDIKNRFGRRLKELRLARGLSQEDLALQAGIHRTYVSSAERGQRNVSLVNLDNFARALDVDICELLPDKRR